MLKREQAMRLAGRAPEADVEENCSVVPGITEGGGAASCCEVVPTSGSLLGLATVVWSRDKDKT